MSGKFTLVILLLLASCGELPDKQCRPFDPDTCGQDFEADLLSGCNLRKPVVNPLPHCDPREEEE